MDVRRTLLTLAAAALLLATARPHPARAQGRSAPVVVGSKAFTESVVLGEVLTLRLRSAGIEARHRSELGGTRILWNALMEFSR